MNGFFNIGTGELMVIIVIAILVIGPRRMLELGQAVGRLTQRGRRIWGEVMKTIQAELQDTKEAVEEIAAGSSGLAAEVKATSQETSKALQKSKAETFDMKTELEEIGRETQQVMKEVTEGFASIITGNVESEEAIIQEKDKAAPKGQAETSHVQTELGETGRETQQVVTQVTEEFASVISGKAEPKEDQHEEADDKEAGQE